MTISGRLPVIAVAVLLSAGCGLPYVGTGGSGGSGASSHPATTRAEQSAGPSSADSPTAGSSSATGTASGRTVDPNDPTGVAASLGVTLVDPVLAGMVTYGIVTFQSPSGRIRCAMQDGGSSDPATTSARCDVTEPTYRPTAKPASCSFDWGPSVTVSPGAKGRFACVSDTVDVGRPLPYGSAVINGDLICISRQTGITCRTVTTALHGFRIARESYELF